MSEMISGEYSQSLGSTGGEDSKFQDYSIEELAAAFDIKVTAAIDRHQRVPLDKPIDDIIRFPYPLAAQASHRNELQMLENNSAYYGEDIEDLIFTDPIMKRIQGNTTARPDDKNRLMRIRYSVAALAIYHLAHASQAALEADTVDVEIEPTAA